MSEHFSSVETYDLLAYWFRAFIRHHLVLVCDHHFLFKPALYRCTGFGVQPGVH